MVRPAILNAALLALLCTALVWPMLFTTSGFAGDWQHSLWFIWHQTLAIRADGVPSMFLNTNYSAFYPQYAFYGGTVYVLASALALVLGDSPVSAYIVTYVLGFMAAYGGWYWIGRSLGLARWVAQIPPLLFVTSACYLTLVYAEGDWPEFLAMSMVPLMVAAGLNVLRAERLRVLPAIALTVSSLVFFGSHILTVLWASTLIGLTFVVLVVFVPEARRQIRVRRLLRIGALVMPALLLNAWFLLPMVVYASHTRIGSQYAAAYEDLHRTMHLVSFRHLFTLSRATTVRTHPDYALALPTLTIVWVLASIVIVLGSIRRGTWVRIIVIFAVITAATVILMTHVGLLLALPKPYTLLQFSYRLESYVLMGVTALVLVVLMLAKSGSRRLRLWAWTIVPILALSVVGASQQLSAHPDTPLNRDVTFTEISEVFSREFDDYSYVPLPFISEQRLPTLEIPPGWISGNRVLLNIRVHPGQLVATNIGGGPDLLRIQGASIAGTDERAHLVLAVGTHAPAGSSAARKPVVAERITISPAQSAPVVLGRLLTVAGAAILLVELVWLSVGRYRRPRAHPASGLQ
jgi:hypothetical protein